MASELRLGRTGLVVWLLLPVVVVGMLALLMDRSKGRPRPELMHAPADLGTNVLVSTPGANARAGQPAGQVQPESLAQGFIIVVEDKAKLAGAASPIYIGTNHNGWNPGDPAWKMTARSDGRWQLALKKPDVDSKMELKFTRGDWDHVEVAQDLKDISNRMLPLLEESAIKGDEPPVLDFVVEKWADQRAGTSAGEDDPYGEIKVAGGRIVRIQTAGGGVPMQNRDLLVWLPPGYDDAASAQRRYPVLYMQDGQNLFQKHARIPAEWGVDETATRLIGERRIEPLVVVGIPNAGAGRMSEYMPVEGLKGVEPRGGAYVEWVLREVMPRVEHVVRVKTGPENTAIGGSSLGGLISLYAGLKHPEVFGKLLAESPSLVLGGREVWKTLVPDAKAVPARVYLAMGGKEGSEAEAGALIAATRSMNDWLHERGGAAAQQDMVIEDGARHDEAAWAARLPGALEFLFPATQR